MEQTGCHDNFPISQECDLGSNRIVYAQTWKKLYYVFINIVMFFLPIIVMIICYFLIIAKLYTTSSPGERVVCLSPQAKAKRKVVQLVLVVLTVFVICWSPHQIPMAHAIFFTGSQVRYPLNASKN